MNSENDIFLRAHPVIINKPKAEFHPRGPKPPKWVEYQLCFDCECRLDASQKFTLGFYRLLKLKGDIYELIEEGAFYDDDLPAKERKVLEEYIHTHTSDVESFPPRFPLYYRSEFVKKIFYKYARKGATIRLLRNTGLGGK